nr:unnamed protein product [Callosobruchus chinensis]
MFQFPSAPYCLQKCMVPSPARLRELTNQVRHYVSAQIVHFGLGRAGVISSDGALSYN